MSQSKSKEEEARVYLLPKKGSSYVHLPDDSSKVTQIKVTDLQIEDFLERLNESVQLQEAMTTTGNQNLYLQVTVTVIVPENSDDDEWIIQR